MKTIISSIGTATPPYKRSQQETVELVAAGLTLKPAEKRLLKSVYKATGIIERYSVLSDYAKSPGQFEIFPNHINEPFPTTAKRMELYKQNALPLALSAINNCLAQIPAVRHQAITHLITVSCTGMYAPGLDIEIVHELNLNPSVERTAINFMGCYGAFNGLKVANAICKAHPQAQVLLVCVELCSIHFQKNMTLDNVIANAIFADGSAAVLIQQHTEQNKYLSLENFYCDLLPQTKKEMAWQIADYGFDIVLSSYVPEIIKSGIGGFTQKLLALNSYFSEIDLYAIHPGGLKILQACEEALNITAEDNRHAYQILKNYGNMSSATILFVLKAIWDATTKTSTPKKILSCAFGPGLTLEAMLLQFMS